MGDPDVVLAAILYVRLNNHRNRLTFRPVVRVWDAPRRSRRVIPLLANPSMLRVSCFPPHLAILGSITAFSVPFRLDPTIFNVHSPSVPPHRRVYGPMILLPTVLRSRSLSQLLCHAVQRRLVEAAPSRRTRERLWQSSR